MAKHTPALPSTLVTRLQSLGHRLRQARYRRRMTQEDLAGRVGITTTTLAKLEAGNPTVSFATALMVLAELDMAGDIDNLAAVDPVGQSIQDESLKGPPRGRREIVTW